MTHWGWNNTDDEDSLTDTEPTSSDCDYIVISSSSSESEEEKKDNNAILEEKEISIQEPLPSVGIQSQTLQRTYSNLSGICRSSTTQSGMEVLRHSPQSISSGSDGSRSSTFISSPSRKWGN